MRCTIWHSDEKGLRSANGVVFLLTICLIKVYTSTAQRQACKGGSVRPGRTHEFQPPKSRVSKRTLRKLIRLPMLDDELEGAQTLIVIDVGAISRPDARGQGSPLVESDGLQAYAGRRQQKLRVLVTDAVLVQDGKFAVEDR